MKLTELSGASGVPVTPVFMIWFTSETIWPASP